jgi:parallel beta-helix repeat protein
MKLVSFKKCLVVGAVLWLAGAGFNPHFLVGEVVNEITLETFDTIQGAINDSNTLPGHRLRVEPGIYYENVTVNKASLTITGYPYSQATVNGGAGNTFTISANNVSIQYLTITTNGSYHGVKINSDYTYNTIWGNTIQDCNRGVWVYSSHNTIKENDFQGCMWSAQVNSSDNIIYKNTFRDCDRGVYLYPSTSVGNVVCHNLFSDFATGIYLAFCSGNWIYSNIINGDANPQYGDHGITMAAANGNSIYGNTIKDCYNGLFMEYSNNNKIHHNNFMNNTTNHAYSYAGSGNIWDTGNAYGNYWSNASCTDSNSDGVCDSYYSIAGGSEQDPHPLVAAWYIIKGNVNGDPLGNITLGDIYYLSYYLNTDPSCEPVTPCAADVNGDSIVDANDTTYLSNYLFFDGPAPVGNCEAQLVLPRLFEK